MNTVNPPLARFFRGALSRWASDIQGELDSAHGPAGTDRETSLAEELHVVEAALQRLGEGVYGLCQDCGAGIDIVRLLRQPATQRCAACEALEERMASSDRQQQPELARQGVAPWTGEARS